MLIDTLSITSTRRSILYIKGYISTNYTFQVQGKFFIVFGDSMPACFDNISKGMDTVRTRLDALQFRISETFSR